MARVLNVAEKPSIAKTIAGILSGGGFRSREGFSRYNKCFDFKCTFGIPGRFPERQVDMTMTSVSGHLNEMDFDAQYKSWRSCDPSALFDARIVESTKNKDIAKTLQQEAKTSGVLIIWTDCDREGEGIGYEIQQTCLAKNKNLLVKRARFSCANKTDIWRAVKNLKDLNMNEVNAVRTRQEVDLRLGAAFTRLQTLGLQQRFEAELMSFGPCQLPTLGFIVRRFELISAFKPEPFWTIKLALNGCDFVWQRQRLFDYLPAFTLFELCVEKNEAVVTDVERKPKSKWRPLPLATVELQVRMSKFCRVSSERTMEAAEKLYNRGILSYPRTETDSFSPTFDLAALVNMQRESPDWGRFARRLVDENEFQWPRAGKKNDEAHPPIHPTKFVPLESLQNADERAVYEFVTRHFLACCSRDAQGAETVAEVDMAGEKFTAKGLQILERNYLDVYRYERWGERTLPDFAPGDTFVPTKLELTEGKTAPPELLTEVELIRLMDNYGIGTDATIQEHIKTIQTRKYAVKLNGKFFKPTPVGHGLIKYYTQIGHEATIARPKTRADMEKDLVKICQGALTKEQVINATMEKFKQIYAAAAGTQQAYLDIMGTFLQPSADTGDGNSLHERYRCEKKRFSKCGTCGANTMELRCYKAPSSQSKMPPQRLLRCTTCEKNYKLPLGPASAFDHICPLCNFQVVRIKGKNSEYTVCPNCYNGGQTPDIEEVGNNNHLPCYKCTHSACKLSQGVEGGDIAIAACSSCGSGELRLRRTKNGKFHINCSSGQACSSNTIWLPGAIKVATVRENAQSCQTCRGNPKHVSLEIDARSVPPGTPLRHDACPMPTCRNVPQGLAVVYEMEQQVGWTGSRSNSTTRTISRPSNTAQPPPAPPRNEMKCYGCGGTGHIKSQCPHTTTGVVSAQGPRGRGGGGGGGMSGLTCYGCGQPGHIKPDCPNASSSSSAHGSRGAAKGNVKCYGCGQIGHIKPECPNASRGPNNAGNGQYQRGNKSNMTCYGCGQVGHLKSECPAASHQYQYQNQNQRGQMQFQNQQRQQRAEPSKNYKKRVCDKCGEYPMYAMF